MVTDTVIGLVIVLGFCAYVALTVRWPALFAGTLMLFAAYVVGRFLP